MRSAAYPAWMGRPSLGLRVAKGIALLIVVLLVLFPLWTVVATSLASPEDVIANGGWVIVPERLTLGTYHEILSGGIVTRALLVSTGVTVVGTALSLTCTVFLAYALSRPGVFGGRPVLLLVLFTFLFPPGMIPLFLVVRTTGLFDQYAALVLPFLINVFNLVVMRGFFQGIPTELVEAARLDGAGDLLILWRVVIPLSKAVLAGRHREGVGRRAVRRGDAGADRRPPVGHRRLETAVRGNRVDRLPRRLTRRAERVAGGR